MANGLIQQIGVFKCCATGGALVDYSAYVTQASIATMRNTVTLAPPLSTAEETEAASSTKRTLTIAFRSTTAAAALRGVLNEVINNDDSLLDFYVVENDTVVSADNPIYTGTAMLPQLDSTVAVGELRQQTVTLPITVWNTPDITP